MKRRQHHITLGAMAVATVVGALVHPLLAAVGAAAMVYYAWSKGL